MYTEFGIKKDLLELAKEVENEIKPQFEKIENIKELNSLKVLNAFQKSRLSEMHLHSSTGYGIDEVGRNKIEEMLDYALEDVSKRYCASLEKY